LYLQALDKDPQFVDARLGVVSTYARAAGNGYASPRESWAKVDEHLAKAKRIDPGNFSVRASEADRRFLFEWDWAGAEREFSTLSEDPRIFHGNRYHPAAIFFWARGWPDRTVSLIERALKVDPGNLESRIMLANVLSHSGHLDDAATYFRAIAAVAPSDPRPLFGLSEVLRRKRDISGAIVTLRKAYELAEEEDGSRALSDARTEQDYQDAAMAVAEGRLKLLQELATVRYISPLDLARLSAQTGRRDQAFAYLERAIVERSPMVVALKVDAAWDDIRDDPRFAAIVRRLGIP
jgi:serine/threonine-protein kinase